MNLALGLIETKGLIGSIEAADAMVKAADVKIISKEYVTGALVIIKIVGETAAVKSAVDAGVAAVQRVGELAGAHVIPRPDDQIDILLKEYNVKNKKTNKPQKQVSNKTSVTKKEPVEKEKPVAKAEISEPAKEARPAEEKKKETVNRTTNQTRLPKMEELEILNVHSLRKIARAYDGFPIKGRDISKANRGTLLDYFKEMQ